MGKQTPTMSFGFKDKNGTNYIITCIAQSKYDHFHIYLP
jgi:hypothetical protein